MNDKGGFVDMSAQYADFKDFVRTHFISRKEVEEMNRRLDAYARFEADVLDGVKPEIAQRNMLCLLGDHSLGYRALLVTVRNRVSEIVALLEYFPQSLIEIRQKELLSYVNLAREGSLPSSTSYSEQTIQRLLGTEVPFQNRHDAGIVFLEPLRQFFARLFETRVVNIHGVLSLPVVQ